MEDFVRGDAVLVVDGDRRHVSYVVTRKAGLFGRETTGVLQGAHFDAVAADRVILELPTGESVEIMVEATPYGALTDFHCAGDPPASWGLPEQAERRSV